MILIAAQPAPRAVGNAVSPGGVPAPDFLELDGESGALYRRDVPICISVGSALLLVQYSSLPM